MWGRCSPCGRGGVWTRPPPPPSLLGWEAGIPCPEHRIKKLCRNTSTEQKKNDVERRANVEREKRDDTRGMKNYDEDGEKRDDKNGMLV